MGCLVPEHLSSAAILIHKSGEKRKISQIIGVYLIGLAGIKRHKGERSPCGGGADNIITILPTES